MSELFIGLMSGTSMDAIDAVLVDFSYKPLKLIATLSTPIANNIKQELFDLCKPGFNEINRLGELDIKLGKLLAKTCNTLLKKQQISNKDIVAIGSHGQTIRHQPGAKHPFSIQIGDPNTIAGKTKITTIADFRRRDIVHGGQGAPLAPAFHNYLFTKQNTNRVILNIGGIANITILPKNSTNIIGFDTGPGNILLDSWIRKQLNKAHDKNGDWAASGKANNSLLVKLLADPYFQKTAPKSTGREYFNLDWLEKNINEQISANDIQATLIELTATTIIQSINKYSAEPSQIIACGGGVHNQQLMRRLIAMRKNHSIHTTAEFGLDPDWIEAVAFAWLAKQTLQGNTGNIPAITGATKATILGGIYYAISI